MKSMKKTVLSAALTIGLCAGAALAMDHSKMDHSKMSEKAPAAAPAMDHGKMADAAAPMAKNMIHESALKTAKFSFELMTIDMKAAEAAAAAAPKGKAPAKVKPNHLMVYPKNLDGSPIKGAKVGFMIVRKGTPDQKVMAMEMGDGYGADVDLKEKGSYEIKTKVVQGKSVIADSFVYEVK